MTHGWPQTRQIRCLGRERERVEYFKGVILNDAIELDIPLTKPPESSLFFELMVRLSM